MGHRRVTIPIMENGDKFVSSETEAEIGVAKAASDALGDQTDRAISFQMVERVVDVFEKIDIEQTNYQRRVARPAFFQSLRQRGPAVAPMRI